MAVDGYQSWTDGKYNIQTQNVIMPSDVAGSHTTSPGTLAFGVNVDGVGRMVVDDNPALNNTSACSGALLTGGQHFVTAAHCVADNAGNNYLIDGAYGNDVTFELASGNVVVPFLAAGATEHPLYNGNSVDGYDVAIIDFGAPVAGVPTYDIFRTAGAELDVLGVMVGYGQSGIGSAGPTIASGTKRASLNEYNHIGLGDPGLPGGGVGGITNNNTQLTLDFDNGLTSNDAFDFFFGDADLGFGADEVNTAFSDSGGPTFVDDGGTFKIAGTHSYALRLALTNGSTPDVTGANDFSWGEFAVDVRMADQQIQEFIDSFVPEPNSGLLLWLCGWIAAVVRQRHR